MITSTFCSRAEPRASTRKPVLIALALSLSVLCTACGSASTLVVRPTTPAPAELVPTQQLQEFSYKRILLLPPEDGVKVAENVDVTTVRDRAAAYYMNKLEKLLLGHGFEVISQEIVARVGAKAQAGGSAAARALIMGKETHAEAVLMVQSISVSGAEKFYHIEDFSEVEPGLRVEEDGEYTHRDTGACLYRLPFYELRVEAKMIDVRSGNVLWVGSARETTLDAMRESWTAKLDSECEIEEQTPFIWPDELATEATLERTVSALYERVFTPMKKVALAGKPIVEPKPVVEAPKPPEPKPEPPKPPEPPKVKVAIISSNLAVLRQGPSKREPRLRNVPRKTRVEILDTMGEWLKVKLQDGGVGWLHETMLIVPD